MSKMKRRTLKSLIAWVGGTGRPSKKEEIEQEEPFWLGEVILRYFSMELI